MRLEKEIRVACSRDAAVEKIASDDMLLSLLPGKTEITERSGDRRTTRTRYTALGREGVAVFHWTFLMDGNVRFEKQCDGNVWKQLVGTVAIEDDGKGARVRIELDGRTKALVPEFAIKGQMESQIAEMTRALEKRLSA
jgi:hypothetical protein